MGEGVVDLAKRAREEVARLQALRAETPTGQRDAAYADLKLLNEAFDDQKITVGELGEAYAIIRDRLIEIDKAGKGASKSFDAKSLKPFADDVGAQMREVTNAVRNVGMTFENALVESVKKARIEVGTILGAIAEDIARMMIHQSITTPLFNAIGAGLGGGLGKWLGNKTPTPSADGFGMYGGARAGGGPVSAGIAYTVGETGRETFVPATDGVIIPNGGGRSGGGNIYQTIVVPAGVDAGVVTRAAALGASLARSSIARDMRTGAFSS